MFYKLFKILFPSVCAKCGYLGDALCEKCLPNLKFEPHVRDLPELRVCSAMYYTDDSLLGPLIHPFKYNHQEDLFRFFVPQMVASLKLLLEPSEVVLVPVPLYKKRQDERGYNQAEVLARWIAKEVGCEVLNALARVRDTGSQATLSHKSDRQKNLDGAFSVISPIPFGSQIVIIDDIVTTGSTLIACADALKKAGAVSVCALTLADRPL